MNNNHTNAFVDLNGVPYLLAEYVDRDTFQQIDRAAVRSEINVDTSEAMRTIIDINIDDIGKKSDGTLNLRSNGKMQECIINMIKSNFYELHHHLPVLKRGLVLRVYYQLENRRTGNVIRSMMEDLRITDRNYFVDVTNTIDDNALIINFGDTIVSTIDQFTHGRDPMMFRITSVQMFYECVRPPKMKPRTGDGIYNSPQPPFQNIFNEEQAMYYYHKGFQNRQFIGEPYYEQITPHAWYDFNRFYHFDNEQSDIVLHQEEIDNRSNKKLLLSCGTVAINRVFLINPGSRIIFKLSIWKNDIALFNDTKPVAEALNVPSDRWKPIPPNPVEPLPPVDHHPHPCCPPYPPYRPNEYWELMRIMEMGKRMDYRQNKEINMLNDSIKKLSQFLEEKYEGTDLPDGSTDVLPEHDRPKPGIIRILDKINDLQRQIDSIVNHEEQEGDPVPITKDQIDKILADLEADWEDDWEYNDSASSDPDDITF